MFEILVMEGDGRFRSGDGAATVKSETPLSCCGHNNVAPVVGQTSGRSLTAGNFDLLNTDVIHEQYLDHLQVRYCLV